MSPPPPFPYDYEDDPKFTYNHETKADHTYFNGKVLLAAVVSIAVVAFLVTLVRIYARCIAGNVSRRDEESRVRTQELTEHPRSRGLDPVVIVSLPIFEYKQIDDGTSNSSSTECAVCLSLLEDDEIVRLLPNCRHTFHAECIDKWFVSRSTCPVCRTEADPRVARTGDGPTASPDHHHHHHHHVTIVSPLDPTVASEGCNKEAGGSTSRLSSFRRMLSLGRSSSSTGRVQAEVEDVVSEDLERQTSSRLSSRHG